MTFNIAVQQHRNNRRRTHRKLRRRSGSFWEMLSGRKYGKNKYSSRFLMAMAVSIISSISFLWVLFLVMMSG